MYICSNHIIVSLYIIKAPTNMRIYIRIYRVFWYYIFIKILDFPLFLYCNKCISFVFINLHIWTINNNNYLFVNYSKSYEDVQVLFYYTVYIVHCTIYIQHTYTHSNRNAHYAYTVDVVHLHYTYTYIYIYICEGMCLWICIDVLIYTSINIHTNTHSHTHTLTHTYIHTLHLNK